MGSYAEGAGAYLTAMGLHGAEHLGLHIDVEAAAIVLMS